MHEVEVVELFEEIQKLILHNHNFQNSPYRYITQTPNLFHSVLLASPFRGLDMCFHFLPRAGFFLQPNTSLIFHGFYIVDVLPGVYCLPRHPSFFSAIPPVYHTRLKSLQTHPFLFRKLFVQIVTYQSKNTKKLN